jgi:hypothetical protein
MSACRWELYKKQNALEMEAFWFSTGLEKNRPMLRLVPRATVRGGLIETFRLKFNIEENPNWKLYFLDVNSLYSKICLDNSFGVGPYKVIIDKKDLLTNVKFIDGEFKYKGESMQSDACLVTILPPQNLLRPFLPFRFNNEFNFLSLCRTCVLKKIASTCPHMSETVRSFTSCYMVSEINYAIKLGYQVLSWHEIHHYSIQSPFLRDYVKILAAEKLRNSNILSNILNSDKKTFCDDLNKAMHFDSIYELKPENVCDNTFQKQFYKDMQNNFFGRFALKTNFNNHIFCKNLHEIERYASKPNTELIDLLPISENVCQIEISHPQKSKPSLSGSLYLTSQINCLARQFIYEKMLQVENVGGIILACDVDSITFALKKETKCPLQISPKVGDFKHLLPDCNLLSYYSLCPRNYSILYSNEEKQICQLLKVKGLALTSLNCMDKMSHEKYANFVDQNFANNVKHSYLPQMRKKFDKASKTFSEILTGFTFSSESHVKRYISENTITYETYPYGYKFEIVPQKN